MFAYGSNKELVSKGGSRRVGRECGPCAKRARERPIGKGGSWDRDMGMPKEAPLKGRRQEVETGH